MIKAIETEYNGYRFRSRLEARWAVFFDVLGVDYEYEFEGFDLGFGIKYLPDFKVKCYGIRGEVTNEPFDLYIEVKGQMDESSALKIKKFTATDELINYWIKEEEYINEVTSNIPNEMIDDVREALKNAYEVKNKAPVCHQLLIVNTIPQIITEEDCSNSRIFKNYENFGFGMSLFNYETIDGDYFAAYPSITKDGRFFLMGDDSNYIWCGDYNKLINAYQTARQARFEYGETPRTKKAIITSPNTFNELINILGGN